VPTDGGSEHSKDLLFSFRKIFFPKLDSSPSESPFPNYLFEQCNFPLHYFEQSLAIIYSNNFLRKTLKRIYRSHLWVRERYQKNLFPRPVRLLAKLIFNFNKREDMTSTFQNFYFCLISQDNRLAKYNQKSFGVRSSGIPRHLTECNRQSAGEDFRAASVRSVSKHYRRFAQRALREPGNGRESKVRLVAHKRSVWGRVPHYQSLQSLPHRH